MSKLVDSEENVLETEISDDALEKKENGLFIFRRDFRIIDNNGLHWLSFKCKNIHPIFIFTPEQVGSGNDFRSNNAILFMIESLMDLETDIRKKGGKLTCFYGKNPSIIKDIIHKMKIDIVCFNTDYTPYAKKRDDEIFTLCKKMKISCESVPDYYLHEPGTILSGGGDPYQKFTPYYNAAKNVKIQPVYRYPVIFSKQQNTGTNQISLSSALSKFTKPNTNILVKGGRKNAISELSSARTRVKGYSQHRDDLTRHTSLLSAYIKFGCLSIREVYNAFKSNSAFTRQLMWRDFYASVLDAFPRVLGKSLKPKYDKVKWHFNKRWFDAWCNGKTGYPIVDAAMTELNTTGYMHNRARLIVASFLTKTLLISWKHGEKYFATKLTDYDPASNNGNWQWVASTGADSQPYFRIFSPFEQTKKADPNAVYIKKWVPELRELSARDILNWDTTHLEYKDIKYPKPIVKFPEQRDKALEMFKAIF